jgi:putative ABC transport system substrate-binding protein
VTAGRLLLGLLLGLGAVAGPLGVAAQPAAPRVGVIHPGGPFLAVVEGLREGLKALGLEEPRDLFLDVRETRVDPKAIADTTRSLVRDNARLIYTVGTTVTRSVKGAAGAVPVVFSAGTDPVVAGFVQSAAKPGGTLTGYHYLTADLTPKRLEILKEILPRLRRVVVFYSPANPTPRESMKLAHQAARLLRVDLVERHATSRDELRAGLQGLKPGEVDAFFYVPDATVGSQAQLVIDAARAIRLPTMFHERTIVEQGALASYGVNYHEIGRLSAKHVQRVLAGAHPRDLPIENIDRLELILNLRTARDLGLTIPEALIHRADHVIR